MQYYFASKERMNNMIIEPRIPKNRLPDENNKIKRICVSQSINGCLTAVGGFKIGDVVYIHKCQYNDPIQPDINDVCDVYLTGEVWITEPVKLELFMGICIMAIVDSEVVCVDNASCKFQRVSNTLYGFRRIASVN